MTTKKALIVSYAFPPVGGAGVQRVTKFVKYLPEFGWDSTVLTVENPSVPVLDQSLVGDVPRSTRVVRARTLEPSYAAKLAMSTGPATSGEAMANTNGHAGLAQRLIAAVPGKAGARKLLRLATNMLLQPDPQVLWNHHAIEAGLRVLAQEKHDVIFVTAPPFSSLLIGAELSRRTGLPLVLDYRDEWDISNAYWENRRFGYVSRLMQRHMQARVLRAASAVVATTRHSAEALADVARQAETHPQITHIYNGYDADDLQSESLNELASPLTEASANREVYKLAYVGTLWNLTTVEPLVEAVRLLSQKSPELAARLELHFAGRRTGAQDQLLDQLNGLPCRLVKQPYLDHDAALKLMQSAHGLCLLLSNVPHAGRVVPGKLFECLALRKPLFAIVPPSEVCDLLRDCPLAFVHSPAEPASIAQRLEDEIKRHHLGLSLPTGCFDTSRFERRQLTSQLAALFDQLTGRSRSQHNLQIEVAPSTETVPIRCLSQFVGANSV